MTTYLRPALTLFVALSLVTGVAYPLMVTAVAQLAFPARANGSVIEVKGRPVGSELIGQQFTDPRYFWGRPSATGPIPYNSGASSGSNLGPTNPALIEAVDGRVVALRNAEPTNSMPVPIDLVTASASGLDPHITPAAAHYQVSRVAKARGLPLEQVERLLSGHVEKRLLGVLGEPRVNVLQLNLALDALE